ncbi:uncharacterized protein CANTADRAFT_24677 [Suhomyces tanzawaensis NRRL Y-17324]|uniref:RRM domain-containing protein n=1 Tax=Suhomyces tanzawaensis NRRL Y-17324 TaxID=984487 RepID=A0A1E4SR12_9ASCO|nr:uncharacterized protein CANTADRAFT_24677 [Suhomyces tanzawaensis NRRL Y-17324]ODV81956.1 hypothetical protein CANTADRAFT_24677 [Suhomyces tanzawaensis NRRL Y-17324]
METRIHIGNISPKLYASHQTLSTRLAKFGTITKELELHSKPLQDHYYGFVTIQLPEGGFDKLKSSFNGLLFMGMKLTISKAKPDYKEAWEKDHKRPDALRSERIKQDNVSRARDARIKEASTLYPVNSLNGELTSGRTVFNPNGFMKSSHMYKDISGNTKNKPPSRTLIGTNSYGSITKPFNKTHVHAYSRLSGGGEVIKGRMRTTERSALDRKQQTLRILINGELKTFKNYKTKLWGLENKSTTELTWRYVDGAWKSGDDHLIERHRKRVLVNDPILGGPNDGKCGIDSAGVASYGKEGVHEEDEEFIQEEMKNKSILASILDKHDFEKPVEIEEGNGIEKEDIIFDNKGRRKVVRYDYEAEGGAQGLVEDEGIETYDYNKATQILSQYKGDLDKPQEETYYDEDDEGNEVDFSSLKPQEKVENFEDYNEDYNQDYNQDYTAASNDNNVPTNYQEEYYEEVENKADDSEEEFIPTFGAPNNTETLRSLFNPESKDSFKLALSEEDEDVDEQAQIIDAAEQEALLKQIRDKQQEETLLKQSQKYGLFWPHLDSPFLQTQTQLNKIGGVAETIKLPGETEELVIQEGEESAYEQWFWKMRGEFSRECKRRKRDVQRIFKKKSTRSFVA